MVKVKKCNRCSKIKPVTEFSTYPKYFNKRYLTAKCKPCLRIQKKLFWEKNRDRINAANRKSYHKHRERNKDRRLKGFYGININQYNEILHKQKHSCAICGIHKTKLNRYLSVDHCHKTGKVRGLLCPNCNIGIGLLKENHKVCIKAADYLKKSKTNLIVDHKFSKYHNRKRKTKQHWVRD